MRSPRKGSRTGGSPSLRVGLTGGIASGKTAVSDRLAELGAYVIDADVLAREVVAPGEPALAALVERFGDGILTADGHLDRARLGAIIFSDERARRDVERIIHPAVRRRAADLESHVPDGAIVVHVIPLLVETGQADQFDRVVVVDVPDEVQRARLQQRNGHDEASARARIAAQATRADRLAAADFVVDNSGDRATLSRQVDRLWASLSREQQAR